MKNKREIHALDFEIARLVAFLDSIIFDHFLINETIKNASVDVKQKLKELVAKFGVGELKRGSLDGVNVDIIDENSACVRALIRPVGWPSDSCISSRFYQCGFLRHWEADKVKLFIPGIFLGLRLQESHTKERTHIGFSPFLVCEDSNDPIEAATFNALLRKMYAQ